MLTFRPITSRFGVAEQPLGRRVEGFDAAVRVDDDDAVHGGFDDRPPARLAGAESLLELHARAEIVKHPRELALAANRHLADGQMERERRPVATPPGDLAADPDDLGVAGGEVRGEIAVVLLVIRRRHQHADVAADHLRAGIAEQAFGAAIERLDPACRVDHDDAVDRRIDDGLQSRIRVAELRFTRSHLVSKSCVTRRRHHRADAVCRGPGARRRTPRRGKDDGLEKQARDRHQVASRSNLNFSMRYRI